MTTTSSFHVGRIRYVNNYPLFGGFLSDDLPQPCQWKEGTPSDLNQALRKGDIDLSLISTAEYLQGKDTLYDLLPGWCIAAKNQSLSVHLHHHLPLERLDNQNIYVTHESATSTLLLKVLCHHYWGIHPIFLPSPAPEKEKGASAFLLIGDKAFCHPSFPGYDTIDLASAWFAMTHLPFVFAVFATHRSKVREKQSAVDNFQEALATSFSWGQAHPKQLIAMALEGLKKYPSNADLVQKYYQTLSYELGDEEMQGFYLFGTLRKQIF